MTSCCESSGSVTCLLFNACLPCCSALQGPAATTIVTAAIPGADFKALQGDVSHRTASTVKDKHNSASKLASAS